MKRILCFCLIGLLIASAASADTPPQDEKTACLVAAYGIYVDAQQKAATDSAALSAKYIPESAKMAKSQKNLRLLETEAEKTAFIYLAGHRHAQIPVEKSISAWTQGFGTNDMTALTTENKSYADLLQKLGTARVESNRTKQAWKEMKTVKTPSALVDYQNDLLEIGRELNLKTREAETYCTAKHPTP